MRNRIETAIENAQNEGRVAFIGLCPIDPWSMEKTAETADVLVASGVDILMVHIPNWFPWMEGDVLQKAAKAPRNAGVTREAIFSFMSTLRKRYPDLPMIAMTLYDTVLTMGQETFLRLSEEADLDGFDLPNYPLFYTNDKFGFYEECRRRGRHLILAISYELSVSEKGSD